MYQFITIIHALLGLGIIGLVLMQRGRGADAGAAFGSGASGSVFGAQGSASFLSRTTAIFATLFFCTSLGLAYLSGHRSEAVDLMQESKVRNTDIPVVDSSSAAKASSDKQVDEAPSIPANSPAADTPQPDTTIPAEKDK